MNLNAINNQLQYLEETKTQIKTAIIEKGQDISDSDTFRSYVEKINNISTLGKDTADATATANDIVMEKTAYVNGEKITGTLPLFPNSRTFVVDNAGVTDNIEDSTLDLTTINVTKQVLDNNVNMKFSAPYSDITTAIGLTADKLTQGNSILGVEGTASTGGIDTSDATATANQILEGATAYVQGEKITGTVQPLTSTGMHTVTVSSIASVTTDAIAVSGGYTFDEAKMIQANDRLVISIPNNYITTKINLTGDKIKAGETVLGIEGTYEGSSNIDEVGTIEELPEVPEEGKMAVVVGSDGLYGGTYKAKYLAIDGAVESDTQQENLTVGMNVVKFIRTTYAPMDTMKDVTEDKLFFKNSSNSIWYGAKYDTTNAENPILRIQVIDNGIVKQIGYYDYTQSKWNQEIDEDIVLSEVCVISEINLENLTMMNNEFTYGVIQDAERKIQWVELAAPGTITSTEYSEALETSKDILGVNENIE